MLSLRPPKQTEYTFLSLGAGVQSTCLALMAARNEIPNCNVDAAIFADTGGEPDEVYEYLQYLIDVLPYPVHIVQKGVLADEAVRERPRKNGKGNYIKGIVPAFTIQADGQKGMIPRACTLDYKILPINKKIRELAKIKHGEKEVKVTTLLGISRDEIIRMKDSRYKWYQHRFPLIEMDITRQGCKEWIKTRGYPEPPRSACTFCPYHSNREWRRLKSKDPKGFADAVAFEKRLQEANANNLGNLTGVPYLHRDCVPLDQVDFNDDDPNQMWLFGMDNECDGICGV